MKANELRIGNLFHPCYKKDGILIPDESTVYQVGYIDLFGNIMAISPLTNSIAFKPPEYIGVTLTEEWLKRFGFRESGIYWFDSHDELLSYSFKKNTIAIGRMGIYFENKIHYVHQLQNLYFALTGEDLKIINK